MAHPHKMKKMKMHKKAYGGKAAKPEHDYNAAGSPELKEAKSKDDEFKGGGKVEGKKAMKRLDKHARGGAIRKGHSPLSSAHSLAAPSSGAADKGHMGEMPSEESD